MSSKQYDRIYLIGFKRKRTTVMHLNLLKIKNKKLILPLNWILYRNTYIAAGYVHYFMIAIKEIYEQFFKTFV